MRDKENPFFHLARKLLFRSSAPQKSVLLSHQGASRVRKYMQGSYDALSIDYTSERTGGLVVGEAEGWRRAGDNHVRWTDIVISGSSDSLVGHLDTRRRRLSLLGKLVYRSKKRRSKK